MLHTRVAGSTPLGGAIGLGTHVLAEPVHKPEHSRLVAARKTAGNQELAAEGGLSRRWQREGKGKIMEPIRTTSQAVGAATRMERVRATLGALRPRTPHRPVATSSGAAYTRAKLCEITTGGDFASP
eukprot:SAG11_NODE_186_length_13142_cov_17.515679_12_plen_127_part_00